MPPTASSIQTVHDALPREARREPEPEMTPRVERPFEGAAKWAAFVVLVLGMAAIGAWALSHPRPAMHLTRVPQAAASAPAAAESTAAEAPGASKPTEVAPKAETPPEPVAAVKDEAPAPKPARAKPAATTATQLNVNSATQAQLELLPGIGPALAQRIIADREKNGPYTAIEQLDRVKGIGPKTIEKLRPHLRVD